MFETPATRLAVARLIETGEASAGFRHHPGRPMGGYCLVTGDDDQWRITIFVENVRTLTERTPRGAFYYEGWVLAEGRALSAGAFNTGASGDGSGTCTWERDAFPFHQAGVVRITAEPFGGSETGETPVLEGALIWLHREPEPAPELVPEPVPALQGAARSEVNPWAGMLAGAGAPATAIARSADGSGQGEAEPERGVAEPAREAEPQASGEPQAEASDKPEAKAKPEAEPEPEPGPEPGPEPDEAEIGFKLYPEPATLVTKTVPLTLNVPLESRHPMAPRATGAAVLHLREGSILLSARGLPTPAALGRVPSSDRPYNAYLVWLVNQQTGTRTPLGLLTRVWGENFRLQSGTDHQLPRYNAILITAADRTADPNPDAPQVMLGTYQPM